MKVVLRATRFEMKAGEKRRQRRSKIKFTPAASSAAGQNSRRSNKDNYEGGRAALATTANLCERLVALPVLQGRAAKHAFGKESDASRKMALLEQLGSLSFRCVELLGTAMQSELGPLVLSDMARTPSIHGAASAVESVLCRKVERVSRMHRKAAEQALLSANDYRQGIAFDNFISEQRADVPDSEVERESGGGSRSTRNYSEVFVRLVAEEFGNDLEELRVRENFDAAKVLRLSEALKAGANVLSFP
mmetsp:Transcript_10725/g.28685  ORF Transcript_10725/g.28685 Transcript_10725/m.28685 type:complete len:248 (-) Transcript_10725:341-1084(-)